jgi:hypothetical protein
VSQRPRHESIRLSGRERKVNEFAYAIKIEIAPGEIVLRSHRRDQVEHDHGGHRQSVEKLGVQRLASFRERIGARIGVLDKPFFGYQN